MQSWFRRQSCSPPVQLSAAKWPRNGNYSARCENIKVLSGKFPSRESGNEMLERIAFRNIVQNPLDQCRILGRELPHQGSRPRRNYGRVPRWKAYTCVGGIAGGRNHNDAMGDGIVNSRAHQNVVARSAKAHVDNERGITELAIDLQISQIQECTSHGGKPLSDLGRDNRCFWCYSVESRRKRRIHEIVAKSENDAHDCDSMTASVPFPCLRLARNRSLVSAPARQPSSKLHRDSLFREISSPIKWQSAVDDANVNSIAVIIHDARRSRAEVGHVHSVQVPIVCASGEVVLV